MPDAVRDSQNITYGKCAVVVGKHLDSRGADLLPGWPGDLSAASI